MPVTFTMTGGGCMTTGGTASGALVRQHFVELDFQLPDTFGGNLVVIGNVQGFVNNTIQPMVNVSAALALPAIPGSGTTFWNVQIDPFTGTATIYTSSVADPAPQPCAGANSAFNQIIVARQSLPSTAPAQPWATLFNAVDFN